MICCNAKGDSGRNATYGNKRAMQLNLRAGGRTARELPNSAGSRARARALPRVLVFLRLLCFVSQSRAVQSPVHFTRAAGRTVAATADGHARVIPSSTASPAADCPLCQEAAMAGAYVLSPVATLPPPPPAIEPAAVAASVGFALPAPPLGWLSRAPPE
jgi:hypothetical protein